MQANLTSTTFVSAELAHISNLTEIVLHRHSTRRFLPKPVSLETIDEALSLASHAPSNSNIQPWRLYVARGAGLERIRKTLMEAARKGGPKIPPLPAEFTPLRSKLGLQVYGEGMGIARDDKDGRNAAVLRNFEFFGAPIGAVLCIHKDLGAPDSLSAGMYLQTLLLSLTEHGLASCCEVSVTGYPDVLRKEMSIGDELDIICGVAIGYEDPDFKANKIHVNREAIEKTTIFMEE